MRYEAANSIVLKVTSYHHHVPSCTTMCYFEGFPYALLIPIPKLRPLPSVYLCNPLCFHSTIANILGIK